MPLWAGQDCGNQEVTRTDYWDYLIDTSIALGALSDIMITQWFPMYYNKKYPDVFKSVSNESFPATTKFQKSSGYEDYTYEIDSGIQN